MKQLEWTKMKQLEWTFDWNLKYPDTYNYLSGLYSRLDFFIFWLKTH